DTGDGGVEVVTVQGGEERMADGLRAVEVEGCRDGRAAGLDYQHERHAGGHGANGHAALHWARRHRLPGQPIGHSTRPPRYPLLRASVLQRARRPVPPRRGTPTPRACNAGLEPHGHLRRIDAEIDPHLEMAEVHRRVYRAGGPALLFTRVKGCPFPMASNLFG